MYSVNVQNNFAFNKLLHSINRFLNAFVVHYSFKLYKNYLDNNEYLSQRTNPAMTIASNKDDTIHTLGFYLVDITFDQIKHLSGKEHLFRCQNVFLLTF